MKKTTPLLVLLVIFVASTIFMSEEYIGNTAAFRGQNTPNEQGENDERQKDGKTEVEGRRNEY